jgi:hypothetical protein
MGQTVAELIHFNRRYGRTGTLWEGWYKATAIDAADYLFACTRYIELNPVRARLVAHPRDYRWSSYRAHADGERDDLLTDHRLYRRLGRDAASRQSAYRQLSALWARRCSQRSAMPLTRAGRWATTASAARSKPSATAISAGSQCDATSMQNCGYP